MDCYCCDKNDWHSLKHLNPEQELMVCKSCGNVVYRVDAGKEEEMKDFYRKSYRPEPTYENILTTNRKLNYVRMFMTDFLKDKKGLIVGDVGCATGYIPNWFRQIGHRATGCELTLTYRRFAEHYYGIPITEELEPKHKYDLITVYHVLEHLIEPDKKLEKYVSLLADGGHIMIATPEWLDTLEEASGTPMSSFDHLFHKNHINVFTKQSLHNLFSKCGLEIVKEDHLQYGQTYLLKKGKPEAFTPEPWEEITKKIETTDKAIKLFASKKYHDAVELWPKFPEGWLSIIYGLNGKDPEAQKDYYEKALKACPQNVRLNIGYGQWLYGLQKYEKAIQVFEWLASVRPNEDIFMFMGWCYNFLSRPDLALKAWNNCWMINPMRWAEVQNAMCQAASRMPTWDERALEAFLNAQKQAAPTPELKDGVMNGSA